MFNSNNNEKYSSLQEMTTKTAPFPGDKVSKLINKLPLNPVDYALDTMLSKHQIYGVSAVVVDKKVRAALYITESNVTIAGLSDPESLLKMVDGIKLGNYTVKHYGGVAYEQVADSNPRYYALGFNMEAMFGI